MADWPASEAGLEKRLEKGRRKQKCERGLTTADHGLQMGGRLNSDRVRSPVRLALPDQFDGDADQAEMGVG